MNLKFQFFSLVVNNLLFSFHKKAWSFSKVNLPPKCTIDPKLPSSLYIHLQNQYVPMQKKRFYITRKRVFYDCKNMTKDDWRLVAVIFLKTNTLGKNMTAKYDSQSFLRLVFHGRILYGHWEHQNTS